MLLALGGVAETAPPVSRAALARNGATYAVTAAPPRNQSTCCKSPTAPTPNTLPAISVSGFTLATITSATRVVFSSSTLRNTVWP